MGKIGVHDSTTMVSHIYFAGHQIVYESPTGVHNPSPNIINTWTLIHMQTILVVYSENPSLTMKNIGHLYGIITDIYLGRNRKSQFYGKKVEL